MAPQSSGGGLLRLVAVFMLTLSCTVGAAQDGKGRTPISELDPYTKGAAKALSKAGYLDLNPLHFIGSQTSKHVRETLGGVPMLFLETEHFKLASSLDEYDLSQRDKERSLVRAALVRLKKRLPRINVKTRVLDPWLRLHLYAALLEDTYAAFIEAFGIEDLHAPDAAASSPSSYLGMSHKFSVLLTDKRSELGRYSKTHCQAWSDTLIYDHFKQADSAFLGVSFEGIERAESRMRYAVVYGIVRNMVSGYEGMSYYGGIFWHAGLARWFARQDNEEVIAFFDPPGALVQRRAKDAEWPRKVRARVVQDYFPSTQELLKFRDEPELKFNDHMMLWSRIDFLMRQPVSARRKMLIGMAKPLPWLENAEDYLVQFQEHFKACLEEAYGLDLPAFDLAWARFVKANYPKR